MARESGIDSDAFKSELKDLLNRHSVDTETNTPDHVLAKLVVTHLRGFRAAVATAHALRTAV